MKPALPFLSFFLCAIIGCGTDETARRTFDRAYAIAERAEHPDSVMKQGRIIVALPIGNIGAGGNGLGFLYCGNAHKMAGKLDSAAFYYRKAITQLDGTDSVLSLARAYRNLAHTYDEKGDAFEALQAYEQALPLYRRYDKRAAMANCYTGMAGVYQSTGDWESAIAELDKAGMLLNDRIYRNELSEVEDCLGTAYYGMGDYTQALVHRQRAIELAKGGPPGGFNSLLLNRASTFEKLERLPEAMADLNTVEHSTLATGERRTYMMVMHNRGNLAMHMSHWDHPELPLDTMKVDSAIRYFRFAVDSSLAVGDEDSWLRSRSSLVWAQVVRGGDLSTAEAELREVEQQSTHRNLKEALAEGLETRVFVHEKQKDFESALEANKSAIKLKASMDQETFRKGTNRLSAQMEQRQAAVDIALLKQRTKFLESQRKGLTWFAAVLVLLAVGYEVFRRRTVQRSPSSDTATLNGLMERRRGLSEGVSAILAIVGACLLSYLLSFWITEERVFALVSSCVMAVVPILATLLFQIGREKRKGSGTTM